MAVGLAVAIAGYTVVNALLFRSISTNDASRVFRVDSGGAWNVFTHMDALEVMEALQPFPVFSYARAYQLECSTRKGLFLANAYEFEGDPNAVLNWVVSKGRFLRPDDMYESAAPVVVISDKLWREQFASNPDVVGSSVEINSVLFEVVGVLPPHLDRLDRMRPADLWYSYFHTSEKWKYKSRAREDQNMYIRISADASIPQVESIIERVSSEIRKDFPETSADIEPFLLKEHEAIARQYPSLVGKGKMIATLLCGLVLIASLNVGNMMLASIYKRKNEFAVRRAVGASSLHLIKIIVGETLMLVGIGGFLAILFSFGLAHLLSHLDFGANLDLKMDASGLVFAALLIFLVTIITAAVPCFHIAFGSFNETLKVIGKSSHLTFASKLLLILQIAFSMTLLAGGLLLFVSLQSSLKLDPGYETEKLLFLDVYLQRLNYEERGPILNKLKLKVDEFPGGPSFGVWDVWSAERCW